MDPEPHKTFQEVRGELEASQKAILWEDSLRRGRSVDAFLWKGDPNAKPVQRVGLIVIALAFLLFSLAFVLVPFQKGFDDGWAAFLVVAAVPFLLSCRLFRNAFRRAPKNENQPPHE